MYGCQVPRPRNPDVADRLLEAAARVLAEEGRDAVTARRLASEIGTSTMAVYTHFGSMDELLLHLWREGFARFGAALDGPPTTADPVADWVAQGWAYRRFALDNPHLYRVMFGDGLSGFHGNDPADEAAALATFQSLLTRLQRAADAGRLVDRRPGARRAGGVVAGARPHDDRAHRLLRVDRARSRRGLRRVPAADRPRLRRRTGQALVRSLEAAGRAGAP